MFHLQFNAREIAYSAIPFSDVLSRDNLSLASNCTGES